MEEAITEDEFEPGTRGWRKAQVEVTRRFLASEHPHGERTWLEVVNDERRDRGAKTAHGALGHIRGEVVDLIAQSPPDTPSDAEGALAPLTYLLEQAADAIELTGTHRLRSAFVEHLAERFGWQTYGTRRR